MQRYMDQRLLLIDTLLQYADQCGNKKPYFFKEELLEMLHVSDHIFNIMLRQVGDRCCRLVESIDGRSRYAINVNNCLKLRRQIIQETKEEGMRREGLNITILTSLLGMLLIMLLRSIIE